MVMGMLSWQVLGQLPAPVSQHSHACAEHKSAHTRVAYEQSPLLMDYDVSYYALDVTVDPSVSAISGSVRVVAHVVAPTLDVMVLELIDNMQVDSVVGQGQPLEFGHQNDEVHITLAQPLGQGDRADITVYYQGEPEGDGFFSGFRTALTPYGKPVAWTLSEPFNARQWWPAKQVLGDKADSVQVFVTVPEPNMAASNGLLTQVVPLGDGMVQYQWKSGYPIAYYLISLAISEYAEYNFNAPLSVAGEEVLVQNFIYDDPQYLEVQKENIDRTKDFMQVFSTLFGEYPFAAEKYGHVTAPMGGGMEHQTMSTMSGFSTDLTSHELAHQWFGNSVTCATWSDIWINEGFASYGEYLARESLFEAGVASQWMQAVHQSVLSAPGGSVYVPPLQTDDVWRIFSGRLSYNKGAAILHILRNEINDDDLFFGALQAFLQQYQDSVATGNDFMAVVEQVTGSDWQFFLDQWYYGEGHPIFEISWWQDDDILYVRSLQHGSTDNPSFFRTSLELEIITSTEIFPRRVLQEQPEQVFSFAVDVPVDSLAIDPRGWLLKQVALVQSAQAPEYAIRVFPNPFHGAFTIRLPFFSGQEVFKVYDTRGKVLARGPVTGFDTTVALPPAATGLLILEVSSPNREPVIMKVVKAGD